MVWGGAERALVETSRGAGCCDNKDWGNRWWKDEILSGYEWRGERLSSHTRPKLSILPRRCRKSLYLQWLLVAWLWARTSTSFQSIFLFAWESRSRFIHASFRRWSPADTDIYHILEPNNIRAWYREFFECLAPLRCFPRLTPTNDCILSRCSNHFIQRWAVWQCWWVSV